MKWWPVDISDLGHLFPAYRDIWPVIVYAIFFSLGRLLYASISKNGVLKLLNLNVVFCPQNQLLERSFPYIRELPSKQRILEVVSSREGKEQAINELVIRQYLNDRRYNHVVLKKLRKFEEASWRFLLYSALVVFGVFTLMQPEQTSWVKDTRNFWLAWPNHPRTFLIETFYHVQLGSYIHQLLWTEIKHSDAFEMTLHHVVTIILMCISYFTNFHRIGAVIATLHDTSDILLESAKIFNYVSKNQPKTKRTQKQQQQQQKEQQQQQQHWTKLCSDVLFLVFAFTFAGTRLYVFPRYLLYSVWEEAASILGPDWFGLKVFFSLLLCLQCLHVFWFYLIARMIYRFATTGIEDDERSEAEDDIDDHDNNNEGKNVGTKNKKQQ